MEMSQDWAWLFQELHPALESGLCPMALWFQEAQVAQGHQQERPWARLEHPVQRELLEGLFNQVLEQVLVELVSRRPLVEEQQWARVSLLHLFNNLELVLGLASRHQNHLFQVVVLASIQVVVYTHTQDPILGLTAVEQELGLEWYQEPNL